MSTDDLTVSQATLEYIVGIDTDEMWERRGLRGHEMTQGEKEQWHQEKQDRIKQAIKRGGERDRLEDFAAMSDRVFQRMTKSPDNLLEDFMPDSRWLFIIGMARTGGTYLLNEWLRIQDSEIEDFGFRMIHDGIPVYKNLAFWKREEPGRNLRYEMAQYLLWVKQEMSDLEIIPKKRISFAHALPFLDNLFGSRATYLLTIRHPGGLARSWAEMEDLNRDGLDETQLSWWTYMNDRTGVDRDTWTSLGFKKRLLRLWRQYHRDIADAMPLDGHVEILPFGQAYPDYLASQAREMGVDYTPEGFSAKDRELDDWWGSDRVDRTIEMVREYWADASLELPSL